MISNILSVKVTRMVHLYFVLLFSVLSPTLMAKPIKAGDSMLMSQKCHARALAQKNCHFKMGKTKIQVWQDKIFVNNQVERSQIQLPMAGDSIEWAQIETKKLMGRLFLEVRFWGAADKNADVSQKFWLIYEINNHQIQLHSSEIIQRRRVSEGNKEIDREISHSLFAKSGQVYKKLSKREEKLNPFQNGVK